MFQDIKLCVDEIFAFLVYYLQKLGQNLFNALVTLIPPEDLEITGSSLIGFVFIPSSKSDNSTSTDKKSF